MKMRQCTISFSYGANPLCYLEAQLLFFVELASHIKALCIKLLYEGLVVADEQSVFERKTYV